MRWRLATLLCLLFLLALLPVPAFGQGGPSPPVITSLVPSVRTAGSSAFTLTVNGSNFVSVPLGDGQAINPTIMFGATPLASTFVNSGQLTVLVAADLIATPGTVNVVVWNPDESFSAPATFTVAIAPTISSLSPVAAVAGRPAFVLRVNGANFNATIVAAVLWNGTALATTFVSATQLNANVPANLIAQTGTASVTVRTSDGVSTPPLSFPVYPPLVITTTTLPSGGLGAPYYGGLAATGGRPPYTWSATGLPPGLFLTAITGAITGIPTAAGGYTVSVSVSDAGIQTVSAQYTISVPLPPPPPQGCP